VLDKRSTSELHPSHCRFLEGFCAPRKSPGPHGSRLQPGALSSFFALGGFALSGDVEYLMNGIRERAVLGVECRLSHRLSGAFPLSCPSLGLCT
jgi:hypothetical protein